MALAPSTLSSRLMIARFVLLASIVSCALLSATAPDASAQTIELKVKQAFSEDGTLDVEGSMKCSNLYPPGQREVTNEVTVSLEWIEAGGRFRELPEKQRIVPFALLKAGRVLTDEEIIGTRATRIDLWTYETSSQDEGKKISFKSLGNAVNGIQYRLVAELKHSWRGTWPAVVYQHAIFGPQPVPGAETSEVPQVTPAPEKWSPEQLEATTQRIAAWVRNALLTGEAPAATPAGDLPDALAEEEFEEYMARLAKTFEDIHTELARQRTQEMTEALRTALGDVYSENLTIEQMRSAYATQLNETNLQNAARMQTFALVMKSYHDAQQAILTIEE